MTPPRQPRRRSSASSSRRRARVSAAHSDAMRRRRRHRDRAARRRRTKKMILTGIGGFVALLAIVSITGAGIVFTRCDLSSLKPIAIGQNSFVYAADGSLLGSIQTAQNRQVVEMDDISPWMPKAVIAIEDKRFYDHGGVDYLGIVRAAIADLRARETVQGASTITQQLVRNLYISNHEKTVDRKLKEVCLARKLDNAWSKDEILTGYMNQVFYGSNAYGVEAAAQTFFSKNASELNLEESALLAGLPQAPSSYNPFYNRGAAAARRNHVLKAMLENGDINHLQYARARARPIKLDPGKMYTSIKEPYFFSYVKDELIEKYGAGTVRSGGLKVYTTIIPRMQRQAEKAIKEVLDYEEDPASAVIAIDPRNGAIRAMTGVIPGRPDNQFNLAAQSQRQTGSTFKTFVLTTAISQGMNPYETYYTSAPFTYQPDPESEPWSVHTYSNSYVGTVSVASATLMSDNTVFAQLTLDAGVEAVHDMAYKLGVRKSNYEVVPSIGLGSGAVSPLEMANAYATLAAGGIYSEPVAIRKVVLPPDEENPQGVVDKNAGWGKPDRERVIPDWVAHEVTEVLEQNMTSGTGTGAYFGKISAGKTGTTEDHTDGWFCGYTPQLATAVWIGYANGEVPMTNVHGVAIAGGNLPASIWHLFMEAALWNAPELDFPAPKTAAEFREWTKGSYGYLGSVETEESTSTTTTKKTTTKKTTTRATTTREETPPPVEPPPPPVVTPPPPSTTVPTTTSTPTTTTIPALP